MIHKISRYWFFLLFIFFFRQAKAQKTAKGFGQLSCTEKWWVISHPFVAKKAYKISQEVNKTVDSLYKKGIPDKIKNGGKLDAFRHAYWMLSLAKHIGWRRARSLGKAHERDNKRKFTHHSKNNLPPSDWASTAMDLKNDSLALKLIGSSNLSKDSLISFLLQKIKSGYFFMIKHNTTGAWLDKSSNIIPESEWKQSWKNARCLVKTNE